ncbi:hypothetical protein [Mesorhizobium sp. Root157]|uniref:hypothetical protein n=1 Tax=Mesorhizobium sp. Root157 TaxID=1736477 RepID=UPI0012E34638|nr:hypothetical protein [Mesorhizobium sp. Root157]
MSVKISHAAKFALRHLASFRYAPDDHFMLCWSVVTAFTPYRGNPDVRQLMPHIERKAPSDAERERNRLSAPSVRQGRQRRAVHMLTIPKGFRVNSVVIDPADRPARIAFVEKVIAKMRERMTP